MIKKNQKTHQNNKIKPIIESGKTTLNKIYVFISTTIDRKPLSSFFTVLGLLFLLIIVSNFLSKPKAEIKKPAEAKKVTVFKIGSAPRITLQGQIEKTGVVQITSLAPGVVQNIYFNEGDQISKGQWLVSLSSNYQGGNILTVSRQLAEKQNQLSEDTYPLQKDLIGKQREIADQNFNNFIALRDITGQSINDTHALLDLNNEIISTLNENIKSLETGSDTTSSASLILASKQLKSQFQSANLQLNSALRNNQYQIDSDKAPSDLSQKQKDLTLKQLDIQEKSLDLNREITKLQLRLARINEGLMFPSAPFNSRAEKIFIRIGQAVNPGTPLMTISDVNNKHVRMIVYTSKEIAEKISRLEPAQINLGDETLSLFPSYISNEATSGNLYAAFYDLPEEKYNDATDNEYLAVSIPIGYADTGTSVPFVPIDSVYQTQEAAYLFVNEDNKAVTRKVELGDVYGSFVQILAGIKKGDMIVLNRNVINGDKIEIE